MKRRMAQIFIVSVIIATATFAAICHSPVSPPLRSEDWSDYTNEPIGFAISYPSAAKIFGPIKNWDGMSVLFVLGSAGQTATMSIDGPTAQYFGSPTITSSTPAQLITGIQLYASTTAEFPGTSDFATGTLMLDGKQFLSVSFTGTNLGSGSV